MDERSDPAEQAEKPEAPGGEANVEGIDEEEIPNPGELARKVVEEEEAPRSSTEEGAGPTEET